MGLSAGASSTGAVTGGLRAPVVAQPVRAWSDPGQASVRPEVPSVASRPVRPAACSPKRPGSSTEFPDRRQPACRVQSATSSDSP